jgi:DNA polymerase elongation subunit (family B)
MKGIDAVRRDRTKIVRETSEKVLEAMLIERNLKLSVEMLEKTLENILII